MILIKHIVVSFLFVFLLLVFDIDTIDSNTDKALVYDKNDIYSRKSYDVYFKNLNSLEINNIIEKYDLEILSYYIDDKKYYARNIEKLLDSYTKNMNQENKINYTISGIKIDGLNIFTTPKELIKLEKDYDIY